MHTPKAARIRLYDGGFYSPIGAAVKGHLAQWLPWADIQLREDPVVGAALELDMGAERRVPIEEMARKLSRIRALHIDRKATNGRGTALDSEIDYERRLLVGTERPAPDNPYDGTELQRLVAKILFRDEANLTAIHIWFTERSMVIWEPADRQYHPSVSLFGFPSIISTSEMVLAPAVALEDDLLRRLGIDPEDPDAQAPQDLLDYDDARTTELAKGYAMQAIFCSLTGSPFCPNPHCRLFAARTQHQMFAAQLEGEDYCARHRGIFRNWQKAHRQQSRAS